MDLPVALGVLAPAAGAALATATHRHRQLNLASVGLGVGAIALGTLLGGRRAPQSFARGLLYGGGAVTIVHGLAVLETLRESR